MGKSYLDSDELVIANRWLKTIFFPIVNGTFNRDYLSYRTYSTSSVTGAVNRIYEFITKLLWDTNNDLESDLERLSKSYTIYKIDANGIDDGTKDCPNHYSLTKAQICRFIANLCAKCEIFWDDTQHTPEELRYFIATPMGKALWDFRCFVSQEPDTVKVKTPSTSTGAARSTSSSSSSSSGTSSGSKLNLQNAGGLVNQTKEVPATPDMYWIDGEFVNPGKTKPRLHVSPYMLSGTLPVKYGSGQGFDDCILFFDDYNKAIEFMNKALANLPSNVKTLGIKRQRTDSNGYFKVITNCGEAYIKASKLHEMLEKLEEQKEKEINYFERTQKACEALEKYMR